MKTFESTIKYIDKVYNYCDIQRNSPNRKLLKEFVIFLEKQDIRLESSGDAISLFTEEQFFLSKKQSTQENYIRELKRFVQYLYESEGYSLPSDLKIRTDSINRIKNCTKQNTNTRTNNTVVIDDEYNQFLRKYDRLSRS